MSLSKVSVMDVRIDITNQSPVVILRDMDSRELFLPIWVGEMEAMSIQMALEKRFLPRPLTHDLLVNLLAILSAHPRMLRIDRIEDQTYYAELVVEHNGMRVDIDCRPSDGIAVALRSGVPIYVENTLLYEIRLSETSESAPEIRNPEPIPDHSHFAEFLKTISPKDFALDSADDDID